MLTKISDLMAGEAFRQAVMPGKQSVKPGGGYPNDQSDMEQPDPQSQDPVLAAAPYVKLLTKLGYEFMGHDEEIGGGMIGSSFQGQQGDMIIIKPDGSWARFGPGAQRAQGKDIKALGNALVSGALKEGDDQDNHSALRQAGYNAIHKDSDGNKYYKHPKSGRGVTVTKDGRWSSSIGTGKGAHKLRDFLGDEALGDEDPQMQQLKLKRQQMKQQQGQMVQQQRTQKMGNGTRGNMGTRGPRF